MFERYTNDNNIMPGTVIICCARPAYEPMRCLADIYYRYGLSPQRRSSSMPMRRRAVLREAPSAPLYSLR